ncbi:BNR repeat-containing protein [Noviherbaspirillum agri]
MTWGDFQYTAFYRNEASLCVVQRHLGTNHFKTHDIAGDYNLRDAHNSISLGIDRDGYIHISYDHHATKLRYRRSSQPHAIESWTEELAMTGVNEDRVTYPTFILPRAGHPLTLLYRDGVHNKGSARLKTYSESTQSWTDRPTPILSGADQKPWTSNAYWNHPAIGSDGSLHLSFVWRTDTLGERQLVNNVNIGYAWSPDNGLNWFTSLGQPYKLPITQVNAETVWPVSPGSNLINQTSMALDSHNRPHIAFYSNDANGVPQYQHIWFDGHTWQHQYFSCRTDTFVLKGGGTLQIPISRPEIIITKTDDAYAIYRGDLTQGRMSITQLRKHNRRLLSADLAVQVDLPTAVLWEDGVGFAEPVIDRTRRSSEQVLTMLLQFNHQPDGDLDHRKHIAPVWLADFRIE